MSTGRPDSSTSQEISLEPAEGWHCSHLYYAFDRGVLASMAETDFGLARQELIAILDPAGPDATARLQTSAVSGHKADFGLLLMDPNPLKIDAVHQRLMAGRLGRALRPTYSFVSMTEVSEYVLTSQQYAERLLQEGEREDNPMFKARVKA